MTCSGEISFPSRYVIPTLRDPLPEVGFYGKGCTHSSISARPRLQVPEYSPKTLICPSCSSLILGHHRIRTQNDAYFLSIDLDSHLIPAHFGPDKRQFLPSIVLQTWSYYEPRKTRGKCLRTQLSGSYPHEKIWWLSSSVLTQLL